MDRRISLQNVLTLWIGNARKLGLTSNTGTGSGAGAPGAKRYTQWRGKHVRARYAALHPNENLQIPIPCVILLYMRLQQEA